MASQLPPQMGQPGETDPLAQLRDIHLPAEIGGYPEGPLVWVALALSLMAFGFGIYLVVRRYRRNAYRREANSELKLIRQNYELHQSRLKFVTELNDLLKRVALTQFPRDEVAALSGESWVAFLDKTAALSHKSASEQDNFSMGAGEILIQGQYQIDSNLKVDVGTLEKLASTWIKKHLTAQKWEKTND